MYFDAVLDRDLNPVFNGTPEETAVWLRERAEEHKDWMVCPGYAMRLMTVEDYLKSF